MQLSLPPPTAGTWTPTISFATPGTSSMAYTQQTGKWSRIGDMVYVEFVINFTPTIGTGSGNVQIDGHGFISASSGGASGNINGIGAAWTGLSGSQSMNIPAGAGHILPRYTPSSGGTQNFAASNMTNATAHSIEGAIWFKV